ncbi:LysR family transcriptional regulator [Pseudomonas sp. P66]|uniref:LysR family transcriptional regulator n=1 Tax=Pseudomonas arcuscaelestis TaxID=2710591 RepID=A0ABS2BT12_9PSED|nr:LysR family transcriptional regulator [Pseudomonas arcuscaelestis]MBM3111310.1 LysR family transcriptional regulator [Pseudomonas arcuscaelestis]MBM5456733.1 LysR family transcriptional regulator [Pseudomonas arcuscaelestis]
MDPFDSRHADELSTLLALFAQGSFAAAGRQLQRHPSVLSKRLGAMEQRLGIRLVERTTRQLRFTDEGLRLVERLQHAASLISDAEREAAKGATEVRGRLRLALPSSMGRIWLSPMLAEFALAFPQVTVETFYSERFVDLIGEGFDAAIRIGELTDSRLVARKLCDHQRILCASPAYLERHGQPQSPADLVSHNCLGFTELRSYPQWHLYRRGELQSVKVQGSMHSNDNEALLGVARAGVGIFAGGDWLMKKDLDGGTLQRVLPQWQLDDDAGVYLVRPGARFNTAATTAFKQWIESKFANGAPWRACR